MAFDLIRGWGQELAGSRMRHRPESLVRKRRNEPDSKFINYDDNNEKQDQ
jgi:hypothetical protein